MRMEDEQAFQPQASSSDVTPWTEEDIIRLHGYLLEKSLHDLFDLRASAATRTEVLEWLLATKGRSNAFSFMACCRLFGINSEEILERVLERYR